MAQETVIDRLMYVLGLDTKQLSKDAKKADKILGDLTGNVEKLTKVGKLAGGLFGVGLTAAGILKLGSDSVRAAADLERLELGLQNIAGSAEEAEAQLSRLREVAALPGLGFEEAIQGSIRLQAVGLEAELAERALMGVGNALASVGSGRDELDGVLLAFTQMIAKGKIYQEEIQQIAERMPQIRKVMERAFGTANSEALQEMGLSAREFIERTVTELEKLPKVAGGTANAFENIADSAFLAKANLGGLIMPQVVGFLNAASGALDAFNRQFESTSERIHRVQSDFRELQAGVIDTQETLESLTAEHAELDAQMQTGRMTNDEFKTAQDRLREITQRIVDIVPDAATGWNEYGEAVGFSQKAVDRFIQAQEKMLRREFAESLGTYQKGFEQATERVDELRYAMQRSQHEFNVIRNVGPAAFQEMVQAVQEGTESTNGLYQRLQQTEGLMAGVMITRAGELARERASVSQTEDAYNQLYESAARATEPVTEAWKDSLTNVIAYRTAIQNLSEATGLDETIAKHRELAKEEAAVNRQLDALNRGESFSQLGQSVGEAGQQFQQIDVPIERVQQFAGALQGVKQELERVLDADPFSKLGDTAGQAQGQLAELNVEDLLQTISQAKQTFESLPDTEATLQVKLDAEKQIQDIERLITRVQQAQGQRIDVPVSVGQVEVPELDIPEISAVEIPVTAQDIEIPIPDVPQVDIPVSVEAPRLAELPVDSLAEFLGLVQRIREEVEALTGVDPFPALAVSVEEAQEQLGQLSVGEFLTEIQRVDQALDALADTEADPRVVLDTRSQVAQVKQLLGELVHVGATDVQASVSVETPDAPQIPEPEIPEVEIPVTAEQAEIPTPDVPEVKIPVTAQEAEITPPEVPGVEIPVSVEQTEIPTPEAPSVEVGVTVESPEVPTVEIPVTAQKAEIPAPEAPKVEIPVSVGKVEAPEVPLESYQQLLGLLGQIREEIESLGGTDPFPELAGSAHELQEQLRDGLSLDRFTEGIAQAEQALENLSDEQADPEVVLSVKDALRGAQEALDILQRVDGTQAEAYARADVDLSQLSQAMTELDTQLDAHTQARNVPVTVGPVDAKQARAQLERRLQEITQEQGKLLGDAMQANLGDSPKEAGEALGKLAEIVQGSMAKTVDATKKGGKAVRSTFAQDASEFSGEIAKLNADFKLGLIKSEDELVRSQRRALQAWLREHGLTLNEVRDMLLNGDEMQQKSAAFIIDLYAKIRDAGVRANKERSQAEQEALQADAKAAAETSRRSAEDRQQAEEDRVRKVEALVGRLRALEIEAANATTTSEIQSIEERVRAALAADRDTLASSKAVQTKLVSLQHELTAAKEREWQLELKRLQEEAKSERIAEGVAAQRRKDNAEMERSAELTKERAEAEAKFGEMLVKTLQARKTGDLSAVEGMTKEVDTLFRTMPQALQENENLIAQYELLKDAIEDAALAIRTWNHELSQIEAPEFLKDLQAFLDSGKSIAEWADGNSSSLDKSEKDWMAFGSMMTDVALDAVAIWDESAARVGADIADVGFSIARLVATGGSDLTAWAGLAGGLVSLVAGMFKETTTAAERAAQDINEFVTRSGESFGQSIATTFQDAYKEALDAGESAILGFSENMALMGDAMEDAIFESIVKSVSLTEYATKLGESISRAYSDGFLDENEKFWITMQQLDFNAAADEAGRRFDELRNMGMLEFGSDDETVALERDLSVQVQSISKPQADAMSQTLSMGNALLSKIEQNTARTAANTGQLWETNAKLDQLGEAIFSLPTGSDVNMDELQRNQEQDLRKQRRARGR